jgi:hypothetical protein
MLEMMLRRLKGNLLSRKHYRKWTVLPCLLGSNISLLRLPIEWHSLQRLMSDYIRLGIIQKICTINI